MALTLKHFIDRPAWAAAAGYDFCFLDCMAYTANLYLLIFSALRDVCENFLDTEVRELPLVLVVMIVSVCGVIVWPLIFWPAAIPVWLYCKSNRRRYHFGNAMTGIAKKNLERWQYECEKKWRAKP